MQFPKWFKLTWWIIILTLTGLILFKRYPAIMSGLSVPADTFVFLVFIALMLLPVFSEISFFGVKLKKDIEDLKNDLQIKFGDIKSEIRNSQNQTFNATIHGFGPPPPDSKLPDLDTKIDRIIKSQVQKNEPNESNIEQNVPNENLDLFKVRYNIEKQLKRIWFSRFGNHPSVGFQIRYQPIQNMIKDLLIAEIIDLDFHGILLEILSICNYAIHGNDLTENQISFVRKNSKDVINFLYKI